MCWNGRRLAANIVTTPDDAQAADLSGLSVLVADDNLHMRRAIRVMLEELKVRGICEVNNGADALQSLSTSWFDIMLVDCRMGPVDGIELTRAIRRAGNPAYARIPIVMISGALSPELIAAARDAGVQAFLVKPVLTPMLRKCLTAVLAHPDRFVHMGG